jgi:xylulokinase
MDESPPRRRTARSGNEAFDPGPVTVGIDIGTTSVKAVACDADGTPVRRIRLPHELRIPSANRLEHDADSAWRRRVLAALADVGTDLDVRGVCVAAMVPSACAVDHVGTALAPALLYGDERGRAEAGKSPIDSGEFAGFVADLASRLPAAAGFWPAQAVANHALSSRAVIDTATALTTMPLFDGTGWSDDTCAAVGFGTRCLPDLVPGTEPAGLVHPELVGGREVPLSGGAIDGFAELLVSAAAEPGEVIVVVGATLLTWAVQPGWVEVPSLWTIPHVRADRCLVGGPSSAGGLFHDRVRNLLGIAPGEDRAQRGTRAHLPVWLPYIRGERTPLHDASLRASLHGLDLTHGPAEVLRAAHEATGFAIRHHLDVAGVTPTRIVISGGGANDAGLVRAIADAVGVPVAIPNHRSGAARGAAFIARVTAGLEARPEDAVRWAGVTREIEPNPRWTSSTAERYGLYRSLIPDR